MTNHQEHGQNTDASEARYRTSKRLGSGGMGHVDLAEDTALHRMVAVKTVREELCADEEIRKRIERECLLHAKVGTHPHIVTLFDRFEEGGRIHLVMEFVEGETLQAHLERCASENMRIPLGEAVAIAAQCLEALSRIHVHGIVHRDIKPSNIMLSKAETGASCAKLMDFGIARMEAAEQQLTQLTRADQGGPGTPLYMAPEQIDSRTFGEITHATDIYAVGIILYQLLSGEAPFTGSLTEVLNGHLNQAVPPLDTKGIPMPLAKMVERALAKRPEQRFPSALAFRDALVEAVPAVLALESALSPVPLVSEQDRTLPATGITRTELGSHGGTMLDTTGGRVERSARPARKLVVWAGLAAVSVLVVGALGVWGLGRSSGPQGDSASGHPVETVAGPVEDTSAAALSSSGELPEAGPVGLADPTGSTEGKTPDTLFAGDSDGEEDDEDAATAAFLERRGDAPIVAVSGPAPPPSPSGSGPAPGNTYIVQSGDSVSEIAQRLEMDPVDLARWNLLENPSDLRVGQELYLYERPNLPEVKINWGSSPSGKTAEQQYQPPASSSGKTAEDRYEPPAVPSEEEEPKKKRGLRGIFRGAGKP